MSLEQQQRRLYRMGKEMNEHTRALANQAHEYALGVYNTRIATEGQDNVLFYQIRDDKFAELVVQECAEWVNDNVGLIDEEARANLLKHFGVEL